MPVIDIINVFFGEVRKSFFLLWLGTVGRNYNPTKTTIFRTVCKIVFALELVESR